MARALRGPSAIAELVLHTYIRIKVAYLFGKKEQTSVNSTLASLIVIGKDRWIQVHLGPTFDELVNIIRIWKVMQSAPFVLFHSNF